MKLSHIALSLSLALGVAAPAWAQNAPAAPVPGAPGAQRPMPVAAQSAGNLARFLVGPGGRVRGLVLDNGAVVMVHPREAADLAQHVRVGQALRVEGLTIPGAGTPTFFRSTIRDASNNVIVAPPAMPAGWQPGAAGPGAGGPGGGWRHGMGFGRHGGGEHDGGNGFGHDPAARAARLAAMPQQAVSGVVQQVLAGPRGGVRALLLSNNATVYVPREMMAQLRQRGVRVGESVRAAGRGNATPQGTGVLAEQIAFADGTTLTANLEAPPAAPPAR